MSGLTLRSSGPPPAWHLAHEPASVIIRFAGQAPTRRGPLSSNVRPHGNPMAYLKALFKDPLFFRVCMIIWALALGSFAGFVLVAWHPVGIAEWAIYAFVVGIGVLAVYLGYTAFRGTESSVDKAAGFMGDGADVVGLVAAAAVCLVALPAVAVLRVFFPRQSAGG